MPALLLLEVALKQRIIPTEGSGGPEAQPTPTAGCPAWVLVHSYKGEGLMLCHLVFNTFTESHTFSQS